jgi:hypothetical protein
VGVGILFFFVVALVAIVLLFGFGVAVCRGARRGRIERRGT